MFTSVTHLRYSECESFWLEILRFCSEVDLKKLSKSRSQHGKNVKWDISGGCPKYSTLLICTPTLSWQVCTAEVEKVEKLYLYSNLDFRLEMFCCDHLLVFIRPYQTCTIIFCWKCTLINRYISSSSRIVPFWQKLWLFGLGLRSDGAWQCRELDFYLLLDVMQWQCVIIMCLCQWHRLIGGS